MEDSMKPSIYLSDQDLPEIKNWEVGKTYKLLITVKQTSKNETENRVSASFSVEKVKNAAKSPKDMSSTEFKKHLASVRGGTRDMNQADGEYKNS